LTRKNPKARPHTDNMTEILGTQKGIVNMHLSDAGGKTVLRNIHTTPPFLIQKALYPDVEYPKMAYIYIMSSSGGILQGDRLDMQFDVGPNAVSHITTQAATKVYGMEFGDASQKVAINLGAGSYLEFLPLQIIPYRDSKYYQDVKISIASDSVLVYSEVISSGRVASGERFVMDACRLKLRVFEHEKLVCTDVMNIEPKVSRDLVVSSFGNKENLGTVYLIGNKIKENMIKEMDLGHFDDPIGFSSLPGECGFVIRMLSNDSEKIFEMINYIAFKVRRTILAHI
jgi:urease accessory protein